MNEHTISDIMLKNQPSTNPNCVLPHTDIQKFLLEVLAQASFPGAMSEFVSNVKALLKDAQIKEV